MEIRQLTDGVAVAGQITPTDIPVLAAQGFKSLVCNRPDGESPDQPNFADVESAAKNMGIEIRYIPIYPGMMSLDDVHAFRAALNEMPQPLLAYCRSGARSTTLFDAAQSRV